MIIISSDILHLIVKYKRSIFAIRAKSHSICFTVNTWMNFLFFEGRILRRIESVCVCTWIRHQYHYHHDHPNFKIWSYFSLMVILCTNKNAFYLTFCLVIITSNNTHYVHNASLSSYKCITVYYRHHQLDWGWKERRERGMEEENAKWANIYRNQVNPECSFIYTNKLCQCMQSQNKQSNSLSLQQIIYS